ncbi:MAG: alkaline phosphatase family protein [Gammaproteobacteria bacterium]|nr:alkaline phosphatase family protein [Gammaproteobacteria bacterium]
MSGLRAPGLGPIIGHTTDRTCRLWIRATDAMDDGPGLSSMRRTVGLITVVRKAGKSLRNPPTCYFRLQREYDRTGTFLLGQDLSLGNTGKPFPLTPDTEYSVRLGTLALDDTLDDDVSMDDSELVEHLPNPGNWRDALLRLPAENSEATFRTFPDTNETGDRVSFIIGSCRYPGILWKVKHADRIFKAIWKMQQDETQDPLRFVMMMGDQIYADKLNWRIPIGRADTFEEFQQRYHEAFGSKNMRRLLKSVPTYMILDDHEIEDNWTQDRLVSGSKRTVFNLAINAYMSYQWVHGPRNYESRLYYSMVCSGYHFFVLDTRTQRYLNDDEDSLEDNHLLGRPALDPDEPNQLDLLLDWLKDGQKARGNTPKFIVSSSVFLPNPMDARASASKRRKEKSDSWPGFPTTRRAILDCIVKHNIQNVIFLAGDIHCSNVASIHYSGNGPVEKLRSYAVTSSALYWPFPFADGDPANYVHDSCAPHQKDEFKLSNGVRMNYRAWNFTQRDNFCRIDIDRASASLTVRAFDKKGNLVRERKRDRVSLRTIEENLPLEPW